MPAIAVMGAASASVLSAPAPITTSWRLPLDPSMMVTVLLSPAGACLAADFAACSVWPAAEAAWVSSATGLRSATWTTGSPPSGLSVKSAMVRKATRNRPSTTARACIGVNGSRNRRFLGSVFCPSGVLSSSAVSVIDLPESTATIPRWAGFEPMCRAQKPAVPAPPGKVETARKQGGPTAALFTGIYGAGSVSRLGGRLVDRRLVAGCRCRRGGGLYTVQQVGRRLQRLVVLGVRRHVGLRAGLLVTLGFQMAAQRGFALGVGARLQLVRHVLQHFDIGNDALGLDRFARWREVTGGGQTQRPVAAAERDDGLHRALAERARADQRRALVVLQRAGDDFRGRCRAAVDQDDHRLALGESPGVSGAALGFLGV